ncbi:MAG TPA: ParB/RepB/Spo0J family partition protein, partial [Brevundimonas sp.]|nr:ParB/RepB/Spo0J family partition protein [Brevundimonas sp.]
MKNRPRGGLGRGLGALIPTAPAAAVATEEATPPALAPPPPVAPAPAQFSAATEASPDLEPEQGPTLSVSIPAAEPTSELAPVPGARFAELPVAAIVPNAKQPRHVFDEDALEELKTSIQEVGLLQPIVVRDVGNGRYELVMGERRWRAAQSVGRDTIPAIVRDTRDDAMLRDALLENIHRANLNPLEEAAAYQQLLDEF